MIVEPLHLNLDLVDPDAVQTVHKIITLTNSHPHKMAFKIRTTARERYQRPIPANCLLDLQNKSEDGMPEISTVCIVPLLANNLAIFF